MKYPFQIDRFGYHYIDKKNNRTTYTLTEQDINQLPTTIITFLLDMVKVVWMAPDSGTTRSGNFAKNHPKIGTSDAQPHIENISTKPDIFFESTRKLAELLDARTPGTASPGVLGILRLLRTNNEEETPDIYIAIIKIRHTDEQFIKLLTGQVPELSVEEIKNLLLKDIQKGAIYPHPDKQGYDIKVTDQQLQDDPAEYFTEGFLGCVTKKSDEHQITRLIPALQKYADENKQLAFSPQTVPIVITELQKQKGSLTTNVLTNVVDSTDLYGPKFRPADFKKYVEERSDLGKLDIPDGQFKAKKKTSRNITYTFKNPPYKGIRIIGPPELVSQIITTEGDTVSFLIETMKDGFNYKYG